MGTSSGFSWVHFLGNIGFQYSRTGRIGSGPVVMMSTVFGSTTLASLTVGILVRILSLRWTWRLKTKATDSASKVSPLWNLMPLRRVKRQLVGLVCSHFSASWPYRSIVCGLRSVRRSHTAQQHMMSGALPESPGSMLSGQPPMTITILPLGAAPLGVGLGAAVVGVTACAGGCAGCVAAGAGGVVGVGTLSGLIAVAVGGGGGGVGVGDAAQDVATKINSKV